MLFKMKIMRIFYLLIIAGIFTACKSPATLTENQTEKMIQSQNKTNCPEGGKCSVVILKNKSLIIKDDITGKVYPEISDGKNLVVHFNFLRQAPEGIADGNYSEDIYFEIPADQNQLQKKDSSLKDINLVFGRHFFSPEAGFVEINKGELNLQRKGNKIQFDLKFQEEEGKQLIERIVETVILD